MKNLGRKLKALRKERGLTQKEFAAKIYTSKNTYASYEQGRFSVPIDVLVIAADYFGVSVDWLLGRTDDDGRGKLWQVSGKTGADDVGSKSAPTVRPFKDRRLPEKMREVHENARETPQAPTKSRGNARESSGLLKLSVAKLQTIMSKRLLTQTEVSILADLSLDTVNKMLRGKSISKIKTIQKLAEGLGVDPLDLCETEKDVPIFGSGLKFSVAKLQTIMSKRLLTQTKVSILADLSLDTVNKTLRGKSIPKIKTIQKLAEGLGVEPLDLCDKLKDEHSWLERVMAKYAD